MREMITLTGDILAALSEAGVRRDKYFREMVRNVWRAACDNDVDMYEVVVDFEDVCFDLDLARPDRNEGYALANRKGNMPA